MGDFKRGDVVVCVDAKPDARDPKAYLLIERKTYRVGAVGARADGVYSLAFHCIPSDTLGKGWAFTADRFRKIDDEVTEAFREQLRSLPKPALEPILSPAAVSVSTAALNGRAPSSVHGARPTFGEGAGG